MKPLRLIFAIVAALSIGLAGCSSDSDDDDASSDEASPDTADDDTDATEGTPDISVVTEGGLPQFIADFSQVCTAQSGFSGASAYDAGATGPHPIVLFNGDEDDSFIESSATLPDGWTVEEDLDFEDNSEYADIELVGCAALVEATPNGTECELDDDGETIVLELADATYELTIYEAATGAEVGEPTTVEAASTDCPFIVAYDDGQTTYTNLPADEDLSAAVEGAVAPS